MPGRSEITRVGRGAAGGLSRCTTVSTLGAGAACTVRCPATYPAVRLTAIAAAAASHPMRDRNERRSRHCTGGNSDIDATDLLNAIKSTRYSRTAGSSSAALNAFASTGSPSASAAATRYRCSSNWRSGVSLPSITHLQDRFRYSSTLASASRSCCRTRCRRDRTAPAVSWHANEISS